MQTLILVSLLFASCFEASALRFVCYYGSWSVYRHGPGKFRVEDIDPHICTHIVYTFGGIDGEGNVRPLDPWNDVGDNWHEGAFTKLQKLRSVNSNLKLIYAVGGWNEGSEKYSRVMGNPRTRTKFVESALNFIKTHGFDGLDFDWEYPAFRGGQSCDKESFSLVIEELAEAFQKDGLTKLNFINVMSYDLHGSWESVTGHHTALRRRSLGSEDAAHLNVEDALSAWIACGAEPSKLNLGVAAYGRTFTLADGDRHGIGSPAVGPGPPGKFVQESGFLAFNEICFEQRSDLWNVYFDENQQVPFAVKGKIWVGYDDPTSIVKKVELANNMNLGGIMIWSIETDDFNGTCALGKNPLLTAVRMSLT